MITLHTVAYVALRTCLGQYACVWCDSMSKETPSKLTPTHWLRAAFQNLAAEGVSAIKAEVLAEKLGTTKGSFYWHFKDVPAFKAEMLNLWEAEATKGIMVAVTSSAPKGPARLSALASIVSHMNADNEYGGLRAEPAIREWARVDEQAATAMQRVDAARIAFVKKLFVESNFESKEAKLRAEFFYSGFLGLQAMAAIKPIEVDKRMAKLLKLLLHKEATVTTRN
jgi:AcrR family transcriptional regulator